MRYTIFVENNAMYVEVELRDGRKLRYVTVGEQAEKIEAAIAPFRSSAEAFVRKHAPTPVEVPQPENLRELVPEAEVDAELVEPLELAAGSGSEEPNDT